jgi:hypothetical protein
VSAAARFDAEVADMKATIDALRCDETISCAIEEALRVCISAFSSFSRWLDGASISLLGGESLDIVMGTVVLAL